MALFSTFPPTENPAPLNADNPFIGITCTPEYRKLYTDAIDSMLAGCCASPCKLVFGDTHCDPCENCIYNVATGTSMNKYKTDGPIPFKSGGTCPLCNGTGQMTVEAIEECIQLMVIWDTKKFTELGRGSVENRASKDARIPVSYAQTMSRIEMYPKLKAAKHAILNMCTEVIDPNRYERIDSGEFCGFGCTQYVIFTWQQC